MSLPRVAIVGRPNVGKSSLLNMIAQARVAIVDSMPGTTRDRVAVVVDLPAPDATQPPKRAEFVDTGGYGAYTAAGERYDDARQDLTALTPMIEAQIAAAVRSADLVLLCVDAQAAVTAADEEIARWLHRGQLPGQRAPRRGQVSPVSGTVRVVATKVDSPRWEAHAAELASLGFGPPLMVSARTSHLRREFLQDLYELIPARESSGDGAEMKLAVVGKRNAGKSSLVNALAGEPRVIVSEIAGTTRDAVDVRVQLDGRAFVVIDTAGLRRRRSMDTRIEWFALDRARRAIARADAVLFLIDATVPLSHVDHQLATLIHRAFKPCVLTVNKWDLVERRRGRGGQMVSPAQYERYLRAELKGLAFAPVAFVSAVERTNLRPTVALALELARQARERVGTGVLNRLVHTILAHRPPPSKAGLRARCYYAAQVAVAPPTIALVVNRPELFTPTYRRFLINRLREALPFAEVPIRLLVRPRKPGQAFEVAPESPGRAAADHAQSLRARHRRTASGGRG